MSLENIELIASKLPKGTYQGYIVATRIKDSFASIDVRMDGQAKVLERHFTENTKTRFVNECVKFKNWLGIQGSAKEVIECLGRIEPQVEFTIDDSGRIDVFTNAWSTHVVEETETEEKLEVKVTEALVETQEQEDIEECGGQVLKYDDHYFKRILGRNVRCRECTEQGDLLATFCLMPSSGYGHRWGLTFEQAQTKLQARKQGKPISEC